MNEAVQTVVKMIESIPESLQPRVVDEIKALLTEILDDQKWEEQFHRKEAGLAAAAKKARQEAAKDMAEPFDQKRL